MRKILFIDRDGTLIDEPEDKQVDSLEKLKLIPGVIPALLTLQEAGFTFVIVTNQNGIGRPSFPTEDFEVPHQAMMEIFESQGITFAEVLVCPHMAEDGCECRKPKLGLVEHYLTDNSYDKKHSYVIGDRVTDLELAEGLNINGIRIGDSGTVTWNEIVQVILR